MGHYKLGSGDTEATPLARVANGMSDRQWNSMARRECRSCVANSETGRLICWSSTFVLRIVTSMSTLAMVARRAHLVIRPCYRCRPRQPHLDRIFTGNKPQLAPAGSVDDHEVIDGLGISNHVAKIGAGNLHGLSQRVGG